jgi:hypothetical protein
VVRLQALLAIAGHSVVVCMGGKECLDYLETNGYSALLSRPSARPRSFPALFLLHASLWVYHSQAGVDRHRAARHHDAGRVGLHGAEKGRPSLLDYSILISMPRIIETIEKDENNRYNNNRTI